MITTEKFNLTKSEYLSIITRVLIKKKWLLFILMWVFATYLVFDDDKSSLILLGIILFYTFPFIMFFEYWRYANSVQNKNFYGSRFYEIREDQLIAYLENGNISKIKFESFVKTFELKDYYFLYIAKNQSVFFPKKIFKNAEELKWFEDNFFKKIKQKKHSFECFAL